MVRKSESRPEPSGIVYMRMFCGACKTEVNIRDARFEVGTPYICNIHNGNDLNGWTCYCTKGDKVVEFRCSECNYYASVPID